jgi:hypothetical protein
MLEVERRLFVGIKVSTKLQSGLDSPAPGTERYFKQDNKDYLQVVNFGEEKFIGRFLKDGFPVDELDDVSRNVRSIVRLITNGQQRVDDLSVNIYVR